MFLIKCDLITTHLRIKILICDVIDLDFSRHDIVDKKDAWFLLQIWTFVLADASSLIESSGMF